MFCFSVHISWIFAIVTFTKFGFCNFLAPYFISCPFRIFFEMLVPFTEIAVNRYHAFFDGRIIAVVNNCLSHTTKNRFNYIQKPSSSKLLAQSIYSFFGIIVTTVLFMVFMFFLLLTGARWTSQKIVQLCIGCRAYNHNSSFDGNSKWLILYLIKLFFNSKFDANHFWFFTLYRKTVKNEGLTPLSLPRCL